MPRPKYTVKVTNKRGKVILERSFGFFGFAADFVADLRYDQSIALKDLKKVVILFGKEKK